MAHIQKEFKLENGDKIKVEVDFIFSQFYYSYDKSESNMRYDAHVSYIKKGMRKGVTVPIEDYIAQVQFTALELWKEFIPKFDIKQ